MGDRGKTIIGIVFVIALFVSAFLLADKVENNEAVQELISSFGVFGIALVAFIGGLNLIVPVPATAFIPIFLASGFSAIVIVATLVIGTTIADLVGYYIGTYLKPYMNQGKNKIYRFVKKWCEGRPFVTQGFVFLFAALAPLPNEFLLIPLGALGIKLRTLILAFVAGNIIHVSLIAYAFTTLS